MISSMFLVIASVASGMEGWADIKVFENDNIDWFRQYRDYESGIPTRHSIARIFKAVNAEQLALAMFHIPGHSLLRQNLFFKLYLRQSAIGWH